MSAGAPDYRRQFDEAPAQIYRDEAEYRIDRNGDELLLSLPQPGGVISPGAVDAARSLLDRLDQLDALARRYLADQASWSYGEDATLWLLIVEPENARFCYQQLSCNDEQVIGFARESGGWAMTGHDPRRRG